MYLNKETTLPFQLQSTTEGYIYSDRKQLHLIKNGITLILESQ